MAAKRLTIDQMRAMRARLETARDDLRIYLNPDHEDCAVTRGARIVSGEYLDTWVMAQIEGALVTLDNALGEQ